MFFTTLYILAVYILSNQSMNTQQGAKALKFLVLFVFGSSIVFLIENAVRNVIKYDLKKKE